jgi:hypothetical protein
LGHFVKDCNQDYDDYEYTEEEDINSDNDIDSDKENEIDEEEDDDDNKRCFRCGRKNHFVSSCYALKDINGKYLN